MRDVSELTIRLFQFDSPQLQLLDQVSNPGAVYPFDARFFIAGTTLNHCFLGLENHGSLAALRSLRFPEAGQLHA
jgi:hypothetical protein